MPDGWLSVLPSDAPLSSATDASAANAFLKEHNITLEAPEESSEKPPLPFLGFRCP